MQALFVHGMGRTPMSGWRLLARLKAKGIESSSFGYAATFQDFTAIRKRLVKKITALGAHGDYVLIGHSLGGVLLRAAVASLPTGTRLPRRVFLLASPVRPSRIAQKLQRNWVFRILAGDCGQLLGSEDQNGAHRRSLDSHHKHPWGRRLEGEIQSLSERDERRHRGGIRGERGVDCRADLHPRFPYLYAIEQACCPNNPGADRSRCGLV